MKTSSNPALLAGILLAVTISLSLSAQEKKNDSPTAARDALESACHQAARDSKMVFVKFGSPDCIWCRVFDSYHNLPEARRILAKYYVIVTIDSGKMPDAEAVFSQYAKTADPAWVIISAQKKAVVDSYSPTGGNVGYPLEANQSAYYLAALKKATPAIADEELHTLAQQIKEAAEKMKVVPGI